MSAIDDAKELWKSQELDEECSPNKVCKNMKDVTYGLSAADWTSMLQKEGKWK